MSLIEKLNIKAYSRPFIYEHNFRQKYIWEGLNRYANSIGGRFEKISDTNWPRIVFILGRMMQTYRFKKIIRNNEILSGIIEKIGSKLEGKIEPPSSCFHTMVGQYIFRIGDSKEHKICIESADGYRVVNDELLNWCDLYFKANYWKSKEYPDKVLPIHYTDPSVLREVDRLRSYRAFEKQYDICFIFVVRGGTDRGTMGIEHTLRLFEEISKIDCKKFIYAIVTLGDTKKILKRLKEQNIPCGTKVLRSHDLWEIHAKSHLSIIRLGMHFCIPWRIHAILALGACPVFDSTPYSMWPVPLVENQNYLSLNLGWSKDKPFATDEEYNMIPRRIEFWLTEKDRIEKIGKSNSNYFDQYLDPIKFGEYIVKTVLNF